MAVTSASRRSGVIAVAVVTAAMWVSEAIDTVLGGALDRFGIVPREISGLDGIAFAPFLHAGFGHLMANTVPFVVLGVTIALAGLARLVAVSAIVVVAGGLGTWLTGAPSTVHIGASGVVFGFAAYLIARGVFARLPMEVAVSAVVLVLWGGAVFNGVLPQEGISWQGHLFGAVAGVLAAWLLHRRAGRAARRPGLVGRGRS
ncbi:MAG: rhomboid family intramembrane serine protease [Kineosporiaceae bacterium]|nr:rhomboid family intramembrane serine protease [Kineosporiaceae bacterium]MBK7623473.1 rhomboid family intramembrane serine protease [Kineosporiaceae bacterium]MBK8073983.1 rhomboid family intramembrane serine protease [Kineosporiaceae bacterium]